MVQMAQHNPDYQRVAAELDLGLAAAAATAGVSPLEEEDEGSLDTDSARTDAREVCGERRVLRRSEYLYRGFRTRVSKEGTVLGSCTFTGSTHLSGFCARFL